ncbi:MAG: hypothetical protein LQ343_005228 [Gyalolechia ehrenbergii]|nr:MAG: hypothetical protein LQ343_005228 [Gyalolechia ehrenbergii]
MPLAAIESLILLLSHFPPSTISETLSLLSHHASILKSSVKDPIALSAGTDLFQRYIVSTLHSSPSHNNENTSGEDFRAIRDHLLSSGWLFSQRAKEARGLIARTARKFVSDEGTVLTAGRSRVVAAVLDAAADEGMKFRVIYVGGGMDDVSAKSNEMVQQLREKRIPVAVIKPTAVAYSLGKTTMMMVGAEGVVENGGIISQMGTYQLALLAKSVGKPVYVVAESHKFVRLYPFGQYDLPIRQTVLDFRELHDGDGDGRDGKEGGEQEDDEAVDYTPPELITALVTEVGVHTPSAVSEELIKIWY